MRPWLAMLSVVLGSTLSVGCADESLDPSPSAEVVSFAQGASSLRPIRSLELVLSYGDEVEFFRLEYGPPQDCPAGCFFDSIVGVRSSTNLGWLHPRLDEVADADYFDVRETDSVLWTEELWAELESTDQGVFWSGLMPTLAADPSTDREALLRIAERIETFITPHVGWELLENPSVESDREILTRLSQLPVYQGDTYEPIRSKASELLDGLAG